MPTRFQVTFDCADPRRLAEFWAAALDYERQPPPEGWDSWEAWAAEQGIPEEQWSNIDAVIDPEGGPRVLFLKVPEPKTVKNRLHLDLNTTRRDLDADANRKLVDERVEKLVGLGASVVRPVEERGYWVVMADPEGNEFCVH